MHAIYDKMHYIFISRSVPSGDLLKLSSTGEIYMIQYFTGRWPVSSKIEKIILYFYECESVVKSLS